MRDQSPEPSSQRYVPLELPTGFPVSQVFHVERANVAPIPPHVHNCLEIGYCHRGTGVFMVANKTFPFRTGDAVVINHREMHIMTSNGSDEWTTWDFVNLDPAELLAGYTETTTMPYLETERLCGLGFENVMNSESEPSICQLIREVITELKAQPMFYQYQVRALIWSLMIELHRLPLPRKTETTVPKSDSIGRITPALELIANHFHEPLRLEQLAGICHVSVPTLRRLFYEVIGYPPMQYVHHIRLKAAANLLVNTHKPILEIALRCGYPTLSNFNRQFRATHELSPREYRRRASSK